ncbi:hypothetical protein [Pseudomonas shahriarae]|uniref:hypothetical protein n=1 Tax=Pseudomonas shahriarae TaxID=2745512 RepID=UPI002361CBBC|nr:hypothetical protein [Pseudomonas shahriarae]MDD1135810.1 hypothetical protein [Pseudomonas shahriarae]
MADEDVLKNTARPVLYSEALKYFHDTKRKPSCPTCDYSGAWNLIVDPSLLKDKYAEDDPAFDPPMIVLLAPALGADRSAGSIPLLSLECPQCGHMEFVQANNVINHIDLGKGENTK